MALSDFMSSQVGTILYKSPADIGRNVFPVPFLGVNYEELAQQKVAEAQIRKQFLTDPFSQARLNMLNPLSNTPEDVIEGHIKTNLLQELVASQYKLFKGAEKFASGFTSSKAKAVAMAIYSQMKVSTDSSTIENQINSYISKGDITETEARRLRILVSQRLSHPEIFEDRNELKRQRELEKLILETTNYLSINRGISNNDPHARKVAMEAVAVALQEMLARGKPFEKADIGMLKRLSEREVLSMFDTDVLERATEPTAMGVSPTVGVQPMPEVGASQSISVMRAPVRGFERGFDTMAGSTMSLEAEEVRPENRRPVRLRQRSFGVEDIRPRLIFGEEPVENEILVDRPRRRTPRIKILEERPIRMPRIEILEEEPVIRSPADIKVPVKRTGLKIKMPTRQSRNPNLPFVPNEVIFERQGERPTQLGLPRGRPTEEGLELRRMLSQEEQIITDLQRQGLVSERMLQPRRGVPTDKQRRRTIMEMLD